MYLQLLENVNDLELTACSTLWPVFRHIHHGPFLDYTGSNGTIALTDQGPYGSPLLSRDSRLHGCVSRRLH
jgi:hypothetical protein